MAFHTHMPQATALCLLQGSPLLWLGQTALKFYGRTAVDENYNGLALDESEGNRIASVMGDAESARAHLTSAMRRLSHWQSAHINT